MKFSLTSIILVVYNQLQYTKECLSSIYENTKPPFELIIVDNASQDKTNEFLVSLSEVKVITNKKNEGFASGVNKGIQKSEGKHILLLNNDTIVAQEWLTNLLICLNSHEKVGMVGPRTNKGGDVQKLKVKFKDQQEMVRFSQDFNYHDPRKWFEVKWLSGFCLLIKREVINKVGLFDENFKVGGMEDIDYSKRVRKKSYRLICAGDTFVFHYKNVTFAGSKFNKREIVKKNQKILQKKWKDQ